MTLEESEVSDTATAKSKHRLTLGQENTKLYTKTHLSQCLLHRVWVSRKITGILTDKKK